MPRFSSNRSRSALAAVLLLILASLVLAACGSSSGASSSASTSSNAASSTAATASASGNTAATTKATTKGFAGASTRFVAIRACLQKSGIVLPKRTPGQQPSGAGFLAGGAPKLPKGVTAAQYQAALKKCGGLPAGGRFGGGVNRLKSGAFKQALSKFATCLRENGVNIPAPNTSGKGPIFNTRGIDVASSKFKAAQLKCASVLRNSLRPAPGATPGAPPTPTG